MRVVLLGVRGSTAAPGPDFVRYGGHTSCVAVLPDGEELPRLVLDAGTGIQELTPLLAGAPFAGDIVLTHLHWDHLQGLPFCPTIDRPDAVVNLHVPVADPGQDPIELIGRGFSPPHFPIAPTGLLGDWTFSGFTEGELAIGPARVRAAAIAHKGGHTVGVRVELDGVALAYLPDHLLTRALPGESLHDSARELATGVEVMLHDGQFTDLEAERAAAYGHSTLGAVLEFADACEVGEVVLTHHAPSRTDAALDELAASVTHSPAGRPVRFAVQGRSISIRRD